MELWRSIRKAAAGLALFRNTAQARSDLGSDRRGWRPRPEVESARDRVDLSMSYTVYRTGGAPLLDAGSHTH